MGRPRYLELMTPGAQRSQLLDLDGIEAVHELAQVSERRLDRIGAWITTSPADIFRVDTVFNHRKISKRGMRTLEIVGPPGSAKTSLWNALKDVYPGATFIKEPFGALVEEYGLKRLQAETNNSRRRLLTLAKADSIIDEATPIKTNLRKVNTKGGLVITDRSVSDERIWLNADFLAGHIDYDTYLSGWAILQAFLYFQEKISGKKGADIKVVALASPKETIQRKGPGGRVRTWSYTNILYGQYLADISADFENRRRNLILLNMSGSMKSNISKAVDLIRTCL